MVFRGKPSSACLPCRQRRITCDHNAIGCSSCKRSRIICYGYRDVHRLRICDESQKIQKQGMRSEHQDLPTRMVKSQSTYHVRSTTQSKYEPRDNTVSRNDGIYPAPIPSPLLPSLDDLAILSCHHNYDFPLDSVIEVASKGCPPVLLDCIKTIGLLTFASLRDAPQLHVIVGQHYASALVGIRKALDSPTTSASDETLLSIMILTHLEIFVQEERANFDAWSCHIRAALAVVELRGTEQLRTIRGRFMFLQVATSLLVASIRNNSRPPQTLDGFARDVEQFMRPGSYETTLWELFRARMTLASISHELRLSRLCDHDAAVERLLRLDRSMEEATQAGAMGIPTGCTVLQANPAISCEPVPEQFLISQCRISSMCTRIMLHLTILAIIRVSDISQLTTRQADSQKRLSQCMIDKLQGSILEEFPNQISAAITTSTHGNDGPGTRLLSSQIMFSNVAYILAEHIQIRALKNDGGPVPHVGTPRFLRLSRGIHLLSPLLLVAQTSAPSSERFNEAINLIDSTTQSLQAHGAAFLARHLCPLTQSD